MIKGRQIRAARALLDWDAKDLAEKVGVAAQSIFQIEKGHVTPRESTCSKITEVFWQHGIEFIGDEGVRQKPATIDTLSGNEGLRQFFNGVYEYASTHGGTIMMFGIDETTFIETIGNDFSQDYLKRMTEVSHRRGDLEVLAIICEGDTNFCASDYNKYKWISKDIFQAVPFYIYGDVLAIMDFDTVPGPTIMLLKSRAITNAYRKQFQIFWKMARTPPALNKRGKA